MSNMSHRSDTNREGQPDDGDEFVALSPKTISDLAHDVRHSGCGGFSPMDGMKATRANSFNCRAAFDALASPESPVWLSGPPWVAGVAGPPVDQAVRRRWRFR
jgi:hypothetical protein